MSERILIADDSLPVREAAQRALHARGSRVELAADGNQALERLGEAPVDLLITDVHMPGPDGYALCRDAKAARPATRVLLMVGTFEPFDSGSASAAGADGVLRKPFVADELRRRVEDLLGRVRVAESAPAAAPAAATEVKAAAELVSPDVTAPPEAEPGAPTLSAGDVDRIARRVLELGGEAVLERVARELLGRAAGETVHRGAAGEGGYGGDPERE